MHRREVVMTRMNSTKDNSVHLLYEISIGQLGKVVDFIDAQERKAAIFISAIGALSAAIFTALPASKMDQEWSLAFAVLLGVSALTALYSLGYSLAALSVREIRLDPDVAGFPAYIGYAEQKTKLQMIANFREAIGDNIAVAETKAKHLEHVSKRGLPILVALFILALIGRAVYKCTQVQSSYQPRDTCQTISRSLPTIKTQPPTMMR